MPIATSPQSRKLYKQFARTCRREYGERVSQCEDADFAPMRERNLLKKAQRVLEHIENTLRI